MMRIIILKAYASMGRDQSTGKRIWSGEYGETLASRTDRMKRLKEAAGWGQFTVKPRKPYTQSMIANNPTGGRPFYVKPGDVKDWFQGGRERAVAKVTKPPASPSAPTSQLPSDHSTIAEGQGFTVQNTWAQPTGANALGAPSGSAQHHLITGNLGNLDKLRDAYAGAGYSISNNASPYIGGDIAKRFRDVNGFIATKPGQESHIFWPALNPSHPVSFAIKNQWANIPGISEASPKIEAGQAIKPKLADNRASRPPENTRLTDLASRYKNLNPDEQDELLGLMNAKYSQQKAVVIVKKALPESESVGLPEPSEEQPDTPLIEHNAHAQVHRMMKPRDLLMEAGDWLRPLHPSAREDVKSRIAAGEPIDPPFVHRDLTTGAITQAHGLDRAEAAEELGLPRMPVLEYWDDAQGDPINVADYMQIWHGLPVKEQRRILADDHALRGDQSFVARNWSPGVPPPQAPPPLSEREVEP